MQSPQHKKHNLAAAIIVVAIIVNSFVLKENWGDYGTYYWLFIICAVLDVLSHWLKESLIRSTPLEQSKFNYNISISQLVVGLVLSPFVLLISRHFESYGINVLSNY
jgi:hypothetical protein